LGPENALLAVVLTALDSHDASYSPVVLYGPRGVGKSHFAAGAAARYRSRHAGRSVLVNSGSEFSQALVSAIELDSLADFRKKYRGVDFFVVDGLEQLASKPSSQVELLHTLDVLQRRQRWTVIASRHSPAEMTSLHPGLKSRLLAGLTIPIATLSEATQHAVVHSLVPESHWAAERELFDQWQRRGAGQCEQWKTVPQVRAAFAKLLLRDLSQPGDGSQQAVESDTTHDVRGRLREITKQVASYFHVKAAELTGPSRRQGIVRARHVAIYLARQLTRCSYEDLGHYFGRRDHTTALHAVQRIGAALRSDIEISQAISRLNECLGDALEEA
jgi:chromosomal replication initiator protein